MTRRILALVAAGLLAAAVGCGSDTKPTVPKEMGPPLGDDNAGPAGGGSQKGKKSKGEAASDG